MPRHPKFRDSLANSTGGPARARRARPSSLGSSTRRAACLGSACASRTIRVHLLACFCYTPPSTTDTIGLGPLAKHPGARGGETLLRTHRVTFPGISLVAGYNLLTARLAPEYGPIPVRPDRASFSVSPTASPSGRGSDQLLPAELGLEPLPRGRPLGALAMTLLAVTSGQIRPDILGSQRRRKRARRSISMPAHTGLSDRQ